METRGAAADRYILTGPRFISSSGLMLYPLCADKISAIIVPVAMYAVCLVTVFGLCIVPASV